MDRRRQLTLILLRPDGSNRTWVLTRARILGMVAIALACCVVAVGLIAWAVYNQQRYDELEGRHELLASRQVLALSPRPTPVDDIPGAAGPAATSSGLPTERAAPEQVEEGTPAMGAGSAVTESPVRLGDALLSRIDANHLEVTASLTKVEQDDTIQRGFVVAVFEDLSVPGRAVTFPELQLRGGRPLAPREGDPFAIRRFKPLQIQVRTPPGFRLGDVHMLVYDATGRLLLDRVIREEER
jgi:hypothetical protein